MFVGVHLCGTGVLSYLLAPDQPVPLEKFINLGLFASSSLTFSSDTALDFDSTLNCLPRPLPINILSVTPQQDAEDSKADRGIICQVLDNVKFKGIAVVTIDRPAKANSYDTRLLRKLEHAIDAWHRSEIRVVMFRSSNPRFYCAGADRGV